MTHQKRVVLVGQHFPNNTQLECKIGGGDQVTAFVSSSTEISCPDPGPFAEETSTLVRATSDGINFSAGNAVFAHNRTPYLLSIRPLKGPHRGGTSVFLSGAHFPNAEGLACTFGALVVPARWLSRELLQCETPERLETGNVMVQVLVNGRVLTSEGLGFLFYRAKARGISPNVGPIKGSTLVSVYGEGFEQSDDIVVRFGLTHVQGSFVSSSEIQCLTPQQPNAEEVQVSVSTNGIHVESDFDAIFTFTTLVSLSSIEPSWGFREDETLIILHGSGFANTSELACSFGRNGTRLVTTFESPTTILCVVPRGIAEGKYEVVLTTDGRKITSGGPTFSVEEEPIILSIFPTSGPYWGGEAIRVKGLNFKHTAEIECLFGSTAANTRWESSTNIRCISPPGSKNDSVPFTVTVKGRSSSRVRHTFIFRDPSAEKCVTDPTNIGLLTAGLTAGMRNQSSVNAFGHYVAKTTEQLSSRAKSDNILLSQHMPSSKMEGDCSSRIKPAASADYAQGNVYNLVNGQDTTSNLTTASVLRIVPDHGFHNGNTTVLVSGTNFVDAKNVECAFGASAVLGRWVSPGLLACVSTPRESQDRVRFGVIVNGVVSSSSSFFFNYEKYPTVGGMFPSLGSAEGGTIVYFRGHGFVFSSGLRARFGDTAVPVTFISPEELRCICPPSRPGQVYVIVGDHDQMFNSDSEMVFTYTDAPTVDGLHPSRGSDTGGLKVRVHGQNFANTTSLSCLIGKAGVVRGKFVSHAEIECETPAFPGHGPQELEVTINGIDFTSNGNVFTYIGAPVIFSATPDSGGASGGTTVLVHGINFVDSMFLSCHFGSLLVSGRWISSKVVQCVTPLGVADTTVPLAVSFVEDQETISSAEFYFFAEPTMKGISPSFGSSHGGTQLSIFGAGFWFSGGLRARFGRTEVPATFVSPSELRCISPASSSPGLSPVLVSENGVDDFGRDGLGFTYVIPTRAVALFPQSGPQSGGTPITVVGSGFQMSSRLGCMFDEEFVPATYVSETKVSCVTPPSTNERTVLVTVAIEEPGSVAEGTIFAYTGELYVSSVHPSSGPVSGGTTVYVNGFNFVDGQETRCVFGSRKVPADWISSTRVRCTSPQASTAQEAAFALEVGDHHRVNNGIIFSFYTEPALFDVFPRAGFVEGGTKLNLLGDFLTFSKGLKASFGAIEVPIVFLNSTLLHCTTAASPAQTVEVGLSVDGVRGANQLRWPYTFHSKPRVFDIKPSRGSVGGGTIISVTGDGFENVPTLGCRFGSSDKQLLLGEFVSTDELMCVTPVGVDIGSVLVEVTVNGVDFSGSGRRFTYHGSPFITSVNPTYSDRCLVHGGYFFESEALMCRFNQSVGTPGRWVSRTFIECALPTPNAISALKRNTIALAVSFNGEEQTEEIFFEGERLATFSSVSPDIGSADGGTTVLIQGSGFVFSGDIRIRFGGVEVPATFLNETLLLCVSPAGEAGFTEVMPMLGMYSTGHNSVQFQYIDDIQVNRVTAVSGGVNALETMVIQGSNFISTSQLECRFDGRLRVRSVFVSTREVWCDVPPSMEFGQATLEISLDGQAFAPARFTFVDRNQEVWLTLDPVSGPRGGGTPVVVSGRRFPQAAGTECRFGRNVVSAIWLSQEAIQCESPAWEEADQVHFAVFVNGYEAGTGSFTYTQAILFSVLPEKGEDSGGTLVTLSGHGFDPDRKWNVWFGSEKIPAVMADDEGTSLQCLSPPRASSETRIVLRVSEGHSPPDPRSGVPFEYVPSMEILSLDPASGSVLGGTSVVVTLLHALGSYTPPIRCGFGEAGFSASTWLNATAVACVSPPSPHRGKVLVSLYPSMTDEPYFGCSTPYWYFYPPTVSFVHPLEIETSSSTSFVLTITGGNFVGSALLSCRIGETVVGALWTSNSVMECLFAAVLPGEYAVEVSNNAADFVQAGVIRVALPRGEHTVSTGRVNPSRGSTEGGTIVEVFGQSIENLGSARHCLLGGVALNATTFRTEHVECVTASHEEGVLPVSVCDSFDSCSRRVGALSFVEVPVATRYIPDIGHEHAGSWVKIEIPKGCDSGTIIFLCQAADTAVRASSAMEGFVTCTIPADDFGLFNLSVSCSEVGSSDALPSMPLPEIMVHDVFPVVVSSDGGSVIHVRGSGFLNPAGGGPTSSSVLCVFDGTRISAVWVSEALVLCRSPPKAPGRTMLRLASTVHQEEMLSTTNISYVPGGRSNNSNSYISPASGPTAGGTVVSIAGAQRHVGPVLCLFGDQPTSAASTSSAYIVCVTPAVVAPGRVKVEIVSSDNKETVGDFEYKMCVTIESVRPAVVDVDGGTTVTVIFHAQPGDITHEGNISCKIGDALIPAWVHPTNLSVQCRSPAQPPGSATFTLWKDGYQLSAGDFALSYAPLPIVSKVHPVGGRSGGEIHVNIYGHNFVHSRDLACFFGDEKATHIEWLSTSQIQCTTPELAPGITRVMVSLDGVRFSASSSFSTYEVHQDIVVDRLDPAVGHAGGGTVVIVSGNNFPLIGGLQCLFGDEASPAMVLSETSLECVSPRLSVGTVAVELQHASGGRRVISSGAQIQFRVTSEEPLVQLLFPPSGPVQGGTKLVITGSFLPKTTNIMCRFRGRASVIDMMAEWLSPSAVMCGSPRWHRPERAVAVHLLLDGMIARSARNTSMLFDFNTPPVIESIHPRLGPALGGTEIRIRGANFRDSSTLACLICKRRTDQCTTVGAVWLSPRELRCITPRHEPGLTAVQLASGGYNSTTTASFLFFPASRVTNVHPSAGGIEGGARVLLSGTNLALTGTAMCKFGDIATKAAFTVGGIVCASPTMITPQKVFLEVSVNGADFTSDRFVYEFVGSRSDGWSIAAQPSYGDRRGDTQVVVHVAKTPAFGTQTGEGEYECVFDDLVTPAHVVSTSSVKCRSPPSFVERIANLRLRSTDGKSETAPTRFVFLPTIELYSVHPASVQSAGGDTVIVYGAGFLDTSSACCRFGDSNAPAELLSMTTLRCVTPPWASKSPSTVVLEVSHNCEDFYGTGLDFRYNDDYDLNVKDLSENASPHSFVGDHDQPLQCAAANTKFASSSHGEHRFMVCSPLVDNLSGGWTQPTDGTGRGSQVSPLYGPVEGGSLAQISGLNAHRDGLLCRFPTDERVVATASPLLHASVVECPTLPWSTSGTVVLQVTSDDAGVIAVPTPFSYYSQPILYNMEPSKGTAQGQTMLRIVTSGTSTMTHPTCGFFDASYFLLAVSTAAWTTKSDVWCPSPVAKAGRVFVEVSPNGVDFTRGSGLILTTIQEPIIFDVEPLVGASTGGTEVAVRGVAFDNSNVAVCRFDGVDAPATVVGDNVVVCTAPPSSRQLVTTPMLVDFSVTLDDKEVASSKGALLFAYLAYSKTGSNAGGTSISVESNRSVDRCTGLENMFGAVATQATVVSMNRHICDTPPERGQEVAFAVRNGSGRAHLLPGGPRSVLNASLWTPLPTAMVPALFAGTDVETYVSSTRSNNSDGAERGTSDQMECASAQVSWKEGFDVSRCHVTHSRVESIRPDNGPRVGGTPVLVTGLHFVGSGAFTCHFGSKTTGGYVVDTSHLICSAPPSNVEKAVPFGVTRNGQPLQSNGITYYFKDAPIIVYVKPRFTFQGIGGTDIVVTGEGFRNSSSLACLLADEISVQAKFLSDKSAVCSAPQNVGYTRLQLTNNGIDYSPSGHGITFIPQPVLTGIDHSVTPFVDDVHFLVSGLHLMDVPELACVFGERSTPAKWLSAERVKCRLPPSRVSGSVNVTLIFDRQELDERKAIAEYFPHPRARPSYVQPAFGASEGGTMVFIGGNNLGEKGEMVCRFSRAGDVVAQVVNDSTVQCVSPSSQAGGIRIQVGTSDGSFSEASVAFTYIVRPTVANLEPLAGDVHGGTRVTVYGSDFANITELECHFGIQPALKVTFVSAREIACDSPPSMTPTVVPVTVLLNGVASTSSVNYRYALRPTILDASPRDVHLNESRWLTVTGVNFNHGSGLGCLFNATHRSTAQWLSSSLLRCPIPVTLSPGSQAIGVEVTNNDQDISTSFVSIMIRPRLTIHSVLPATARWDRNTPIIVVLRAHTLRALDNVGGHVVCLFDDEPVMAFPSRATAQQCNFRAEQPVWECVAIRCTAPAQKAARKSSLRIADGTGASLTGSALFAFEALPHTYSISPGFGPFGGGTSITIEHGPPELSTLPETAGCKFSDAYDAIFIGGTVSKGESGSLLVGCVSPPWRFQYGLQSVVKLEVVLDGLRTDIGGSFVYSNRAMAFAITPRWATDKGGTNVRVRGIGFRPHCRFSCLFTDEMIPPDVVLTDHLPSVSAIRVSDQDLLCESPSRPPGPAYITVAADRERVDGSLEIAIVSSAQVNFLSPLQGPASGGTVVDLTGHNFSFSDSALCRIGSQNVPATFASSQSLRCVTPRSPSGSYPVSIAMDGEHFENSGFSFHYLEEMTVISLTPSFGWTTGGTNVTVRITGLQDYAQDAMFLCQFGFHREAAIKVNVTDGSLVCSSPARAQALQVEVDGDLRKTAVSVVDSSGVASATSTEMFYFVAPVTVTSVVPDRGPPGTHVNVLGQHFDDGFGIECLFGNVRAQATLVTSERVDCRAPVDQTGQAKVSLLMGGALIAWHARASFTFEQPVVLLSLEPEGGRHGETTAVTIRGRGFQPTNDLVCWFGDLEAFATIVNSTEVRCNAPPQGRGRVRVSLSAWRGHSSLTPLFFSYETDKVVPRLIPTEGSLYGGTLLTMRVDVNSTGPDLQCTFVSKDGKSSSSEVQVDGNIFKCKTPPSPGLAAGNAWMSLTQGGSTIAEGARFRFINPPVVRSIHPQNVYEQDGTRLVISGENFVSSKELACKFTAVLKYEPVSAPAQFISPTKIACITPVWGNTLTMGVNVVVDITVNGVDFTSGGPAFMFQPAAISAVWPSSGSASGGTPVTLFGSSLPRNQVSCVFGTSMVSAWVMAPSRAICISPTVTEGFEGLVPLHLAVDGRIVTARAAAFTYISAQPRTDPIWISMVHMDDGDPGQHFMRGYGRSEEHVLSGVPSIPSITYLEPSRCSSAGNVNILVHGSNFTSSPTMTCSFGGVYSRATFLSDVAVQCVAPRHMPAEVLLEISNDGATFSASGLPFRFHSDPSIFAIEPSQGLSVGSTLATITGSQFRQSSKVTCRFGGTSVPGRYLSSNQVDCWTPPMESMGAVVEIQVCLFWIENWLQTSLDEPDKKIVYPVSCLYSEPLNPSLFHRDSTPLFTGDR